MDKTLKKTCKEQSDYILTNMSLYNVVHLIKKMQNVKAMKVISWKK